MRFAVAAPCLAACLAAGGILGGSFAAAAPRIERDFLTELGADAGNMSSALVSLLQFPEMLAALPADAGLPAEYAKVFELSGLARIRRGDVTATIFGGNDWHRKLGAGSGLSTNPTFFKLRKGAIIALEPLEGTHKRDGRPRWRVRWHFSPELLPPPSA